MPGAADLAYYECPDCRGCLPFMSVAARLLTSANSQAYAVPTPRCACLGFPGREMVLFVAGQPAPDR